MKTRQKLSISILLVVVAAAAAVVAQGMAWQSEPPQEVKERRVKLSQEMGAGERMRLPEIAEGFAQFGGQPITGAPFSAQVVIESTQTLANGSHISEKVAGALYRDSEGRTRQDLPRKGATEIALINDPVAAVTYRLHMFDQTALKFAYETGTNREVAERIAKRQAEMTARKATSAEGNERVELAKKTEALGTQTIEGVQATGTRLTISVPAGMAGNDLPFDIVTERWYSPQLQTTVMVKRSDPRAGETVYRLANINLSEPEHSLFGIPPGFTLTEAKPEAREK